MIQREPGPTSTWFFDQHFPVRWVAMVTGNVLSNNQVDESKNSPMRGSDIKQVRCGSLDCKKSQKSVIHRTSLMQARLGRPILMLPVWYRVGWASSRCFLLTFFVQVQCSTVVGMMAWRRLLVRFNVPSLSLFQVVRAKWNWPSQTFQQLRLEFLEGFSEVYCTSPIRFFLFILLLFCLVILFHHGGEGIGSVVYAHSLYRCQCVDGKCVVRFQL